MGRSCRARHRRNDAELLAGTSGGGVGRIETIIGYSKGHWLSFAPVLRRPAVKKGPSRCVLDPSLEFGRDGVIRTLDPLHPMRFFGGLL